MGFDLEWECDAPARSLIEAPECGEYVQPGTVRGTVLIGRDEIVCDAWGVRTHRWGVNDWWRLRRARGAWRAGTGTAICAGDGITGDAQWVQPEGEAARAAGDGPAGVIHTVGDPGPGGLPVMLGLTDRKSTRLNSSH